jgi:hypothetical protein
MEWFRRNRAAPTSRERDGTDETFSMLAPHLGDDHGTDYETPGRMHARLENVDGQRLGAAGVPKAEAVGTDSGAVAWVRGAISARKGRARQVALAARTAARKIVAALPGKLKANATQQTSAKQKTERLRVDKLPDARAREEKQAGVIGDARQRFAALARHKKGYFGVGVPVAIEVAVVVFDGGALYGALKHAGFSGAVLVYVMVTVPALIAAVNHGAGVLAGAIGLRLGDEMRLKAAGAALAAIVVSLLCALIMLLFFRSGATAAHNATLGAWASGNLSATPGQTLSPTWLGPAQIAGSFAAIVVVAFWSMAVEGREVRGEIGAAEARLAEYEADRRQVEGEIEASYEEETALAISAAQMKATAAEAEVDVDAHEEMLNATLEAEDGLEQAAIGRLTTSYVYTRQIFANGEVVRVAMPTVTRRWGRHTPPPGDAEGTPYRAPTSAPEKEPVSPPSQPSSSDGSSNGHHDVPPEELAGLV